MQIRCRNCGVAREIPAFHGALLVTCPECDWQETLPARRHLPKTLDNRAGVAFHARAEHETAVHELADRLPALTPRRFTRFLVSMFTAEGYDVELAEEMFEPSHALELRSGEMLIFAEGKPGTPRVHVEDVERLVGSMHHGGATHAIYVTTGSFDDACTAHRDEVDLIDGHLLFEQLMNVPLEELRAWLDIVDADLNDSVG